MSKGYADFYFQPNLLQLPAMNYFSLVEVKYLPRTAGDSDVSAKVEGAHTQLLSYAADPLVESTRSAATLQRLIIVWRRWEPAAAEEVEEN